MTNATVAVIGLGYIGLPTAVVLANAGHNVVGIDTNIATVERINLGEATIVEPGLQPQLAQALTSGRLRASTEYVHAGTYIIAVPTPFTDDHELDISYIFSAADSIAPLLVGGELVILESTSPPLTTTKLARRILDQRPDLTVDNAATASEKPVIYFAHCPERILPGHALEELKGNDRIIGGQTPEATRRATEVYSSFCLGELHGTNDVTAEMVKLTENAFRDVNIAFANELSMISEKVGVDVWELVSLANRHPRVNILQPGPGVDGHCIAVDPWFIVAADPENSRLIRTAREVNDSKPSWVIDKINNTLDTNHSDVSTTVAILGLSFKADIDDLRQSPAVEITMETAQANLSHQFLVVEPHIGALPKSISDLTNVELTTLEDALNQAELVILLVDHSVFRDIPEEILADKTLIDTRGTWR